jgi:uncharacterized membrane protein YhaH (DUF805 family)
VDFPAAIKSGFRQYASARGRASRSEYWYWTLFSTLVAVAGAVIDGAIFGVDSDRQLFSALFSLALILPDTAVAIRRLHDLDRKWPWLLIFVTGIGTIVLLVWFCRKGTTGPNRFGPDPLDAEAPAAPQSSVTAAP